MNELKLGIGFKATGTVVRVFVPPSNKVAFVTLEVPAGDKTRKHELRAFDAPVMSHLSSVAVGSVVTLTGSVDVEALKTKAREDVQVDGRTVWTERLTIKAVKVERDTKPTPAPQVPPDDDDQIPF